MKALKCLVVFAVVAGLCATAVAVEPPQSTMKATHANSEQLVVPHDPNPGTPMYFSDTCPADDAGVMSSLGGIPWWDGGVWNVINGDTCSSTNAFELDVTDDCGYSVGGLDEIFQFTVDYNGVWDVDTMCVGWDTSIQVREETGGGCPGDFVGCDGDSGNAICGAWESLLYVFLEAGTTYYAIVDGWSAGTCGAFGLWLALETPCCEGDGDCDDGSWCNGQETCPDPCGVAGGRGECLVGTPPCASFQECDEVNDVCIDPDPCLVWQGGSRGDYFFPYANFTPSAWLLDDIELERACASAPVTLNWYDLPIIARAIQNPVGTMYFMTLALWEVEEFSCMPLSIIPGTQCATSDDIDVGGHPSDIHHCDAPGVALPDNSGDFNRCEIDFFMGYVGNDLGVGFGIAASEQLIGGIGAADDFGVNVFFLEDYPGAGTFGASWFGDDAGKPADFENTKVCATDNMGECCVATRGYDCFYNTEDECDGLGGVWTPCKFYAPPAPPCEDNDGDGIPTVCLDNCPGVANPDQEDCDAGVTFEGDACETDPYYADDDADGYCNCNPDPALDGGDCDDCDNDVNKQVPGICGCGVSDVDTDGDGVADCLDECPNNADKTVAPECGCTCTIANGCMAGFNVEADADGDGVPDCNDACPGVDDAIFAPGCAGAIPTVSEWGLVILALLLLVGAKVYFGRRAATS